MDVETGSCYCKCGGMFRFRVRGVDARESAQMLARMFWQIHAGDDHGRTTRENCAVARRRADDDAADRA